MMFLAGVFFPFEVMPEFIQVIGQHLPLTLGVINLEKIITYRTAIDLFPLLESLAIGFILLGIAHNQIKKKAAQD